MGTGYICPHCGGWVEEMTEIKGFYNYEGIKVSIFECPHCKMDMDDLGCDYYLDIEEGHKCLNCGAELEYKKLENHIQCSECKMLYLVKKRG